MYKNTNQKGRACQPAKRYEPDLQRNLKPATQGILHLQKQGDNNVAERLYRLRRNREAVLGSRLFNDPAWDILLDIYISQQKGRRRSAEAACSAIDIPVATGWRWINILVQNGYIELLGEDAETGQTLLGLMPPARETLDMLFGQFGAEPH